MHQSDHLSLVGVVHCLLPHCLPEPLAEMLHPHYRWSPLEVQSEMFDRLLNLLPLRYVIVDRVGGDIHWDDPSWRRDVEV